MDRRSFLKTGAAAVAVAGLEAGLPLAAHAAPSQAPGALPGANLKGSAEKMKVRFLGTGAADWKGPDSRGEYRRLSSILVNDAFLIDFTHTDKEMLPAGVCPEAIFYTHSHGDHFDPAEALMLGLKRVYLSETWLERAKKNFREASEKTGLPIPEIIPVTIGGKYAESGVVVTALPANHATGDLKEQTLIYLLESNDARVLYATDTGGILGVAARCAGFDGHTNGPALTGVIMEATMGLGHENDYRIFNHSSVATVSQFITVLNNTSRYKPKYKKQPVYLTHMARTLHGTQAELDKSLPKPLKAAYDGLEVEF